MGDPEGSEESDKLYHAGNGPIPRTLTDRYELEDKLGEGGMGVVYRARDTKLNRPVAIKFLSARLADAAARHRFQREAQTASSLNHPHILTVYDAGEFQGQQYLVTEFVDGGTLKAWSRAAKRSWRDIVESFAAPPMDSPSLTQRASFTGTLSPITYLSARVATPSSRILAWQSWPKAVTSI